MPSHPIPSLLPAENVLTASVTRGARGAPVKLAQEWLSLNGIHVKIDGDFGPATEAAVRAFQSARGLSVTGAVDQATLDALIAPMLRALQPLPVQGRSLGQMVVALAEQHLREHPREIGGANRGPWVRLYMGGNEGNEWLWCAGFVSFMLREAARALGQAAPIGSTFSCDILAADAHRKGRFVAEGEVAAQGLAAAVTPGMIFLQRRTASDWVHTGLVVAVRDDVVKTIEGNTNDTGDREGCEVCKRYRAVRSMDFVRVD